jgi:hypothetical protein
MRIDRCVTDDAETVSHYHLLNVSAVVKYSAQPMPPMRHDKMSNQPLSLLHNLMIAAIPSSAAPLWVHEQKEYLIEPRVTQADESIRARTSSQNGGRRKTCRELMAQISDVQKKARVVSAATWDTLTQAQRNSTAVRQSRNGGAGVVVESSRR